MVKHKSLHSHGKHLTIKNLRLRRNIISQDYRYLGFRFEVEPSDTIINEGETTILNCKYQITSSLIKTDNFPSLTERIEWRKDGTLIRFSSRIKTLTNGSLLITNTVPSDEGIYQCVVYLSFSSISWIFLSKRISLNLLVLQRFEYQPINQKVFLNQSAAFQCVSNSKLETTIEWYKDNQLLKKDNEKKNYLENIHVIPISKTLIIENVQQDSVGVYKCIARIGSKSRSSQLAILEINENNVLNSLISKVLEPRSQALLAGQSFVLECLANGNPKPKIRWFHNSKPIIENERITYTGYKNTSLLVNNSELSDAGLYTCEISNKHEILNLNATILIKTAPKIIKGPEDKFLQETLDAEFECLVEGSPPPRITWYKNGEVIVPSEYFVIASNKLKIFGLVKDDQAVYQCFAENDVGSVQASAQLAVDAAEILSRYYALFGKESNASSSVYPKQLNEIFFFTSPFMDDLKINSTTHLPLTSIKHKNNRHLPLPPLSIQSSEITNQSVVIKWEPNPINTDVFAYHIFYREKNSSRERLINSSLNSVFISFLQPKTPYLIRVAAENHAGIGLSSEPIVFTTKKTKILLGKVQNLRAEVLSSESINVEWDPPNTEYKIKKLRYKLFYIKANSSEDENETQVLMVKTSYTLHGLEKFTNYIIRVVADGEEGEGLSSDPIIIKTFSNTPSGPPQNIRLQAIDTKIIQVSWDPPLIEHRNGIITGYKIRYKTKKKGAKGNVIIINNSTDTHVIEELEPNSYYTVRVAAMTQNGTGVFSDWFGITTPMEEREETQIVGAPSELRVYAGHDYIKVSWLPPRDESIMIRGYLIGWGINVPDVEKKTVDVSVRNYVIKGLKSNREYVISLRAFNNVGNGFPIYETVRTIAQNSENMQTDDSNVFQNLYLSTPIGLNAEAISSSAIRVSWTDTNEGFNQQYTIRYNSSNDNNGKIRELNTSEVEQVIDGLKPNTQYEFAVKLVGSSQWSMSVVNKTFPAPPSSAPKDLTIFTNYNNPNIVTLSWQPPKYANGEIEDYIILYSDRLNLSDKDWIMDSVKGDQLSINVKNLLPSTTYYFKIQARNIKGYGPLSPISIFTTGNLNNYVESNYNSFEKNFQNNNVVYNVLGYLVTKNYVYFLVGIVCVILLFFIIAFTVFCIQRQSTNKSIRNRKNFVAGKKFSSSTFLNINNQPDLWIQQNGERFLNANNGRREVFVDFMESSQNLTQDLKVLDKNNNESPPPRYQTLQEKDMSYSQTSYYSQKSSHTNLSHQSVQLKKNLPSNSSHIVPKTLFNKDLQNNEPFFGSDQNVKSMVSSIKSNNNQIKELTKKIDENYQKDKTKSVFNIPSTFKTFFAGAAKIKDSNKKVNDIVKSVSEQTKTKVVNFSSNVNINDNTISYKQKLTLPFFPSLELSNNTTADNNNLSQSYHQSSTSLELTRQKTPQILYTGVNRQPIAKVEFVPSEQNSYSGSNVALQVNNTPSPAFHYNDTNEPSYQTVRGLKSFAQMNNISSTNANSSPYLSGNIGYTGNDQKKTPHIVRPVVFASPTMRNTAINGKPAGVVIGQKAFSEKLPIGRATAQPRVNVIDTIYSPYSTVRVIKDDAQIVDKNYLTDVPDKYSKDGNLKNVSSNEQINEIEQMHEIDHMIDTLQQLQQEFTEN